MKELSLIILFLIGANFTSCATGKPPLWYDKYGILHREEVSMDEIEAVRITNGVQDIPNGCVRLRNVYLKGTFGLDWALKEEAAKMGGTHINRSYITL